MTDYNLVFLEKIPQISSTACKPLRRSIGWCKQRLRNIHLYSR